MHKLNFEGYRAEISSTLIPMGFTNGEFVFTPGYGSGIFGQPYDNSTPQGQIYGPAGFKPVPFWCRRPERRKLTLLHFMEHRARLSKQQTATLEERSSVVAVKLDEIWVRRCKANEKRRDHPAFDRIRYVKRRKRKKKVPILSVFTSSCAWFEATKDFPAFLEKIVDDYFPPDDNGVHWDFGQIAHYTGGGIENKSRVRRILKKVDEIGQALYPEPSPSEIETAQPPVEESKADKPFFDDLDLEDSF